MKNVTVLAGNGLSIALNPNFRLEKLTELAYKKMSELKSEQYTDILKAFAADKSEQDCSSDFETLAGIFDELSDILTDLSDLSKRLENINGLTDSFKQQSFLDKTQEIITTLQNIKTAVVAAVLSQITTLQQNVDNTKGLETLVKNIIDSFESTTFATLNYDTLLDSALVRNHKDGLCDLASGFNEFEVTTTSGSEGSIKVYPLRERLSDLPSADKYKIKLFHLHGSICFIGTNGGHLAKFPINTMYGEPGDAFYKCIAKGNGQYDNSLAPFAEDRIFNRPLVVLTNVKNKSKQITQQPFLLAYEATKDSLEKSSHWLILGYSFRDDPVNQLLCEVLQTRSKLGDGTQILVISSGNDLDKPTIKNKLKLDDPNNKYSSSVSFYFDNNGIFSDSPNEDCWKREPWNQWSSSNNNH